MTSSKIQAKTENQAKKKAIAKAKAMAPAVAANIGSTPKTTFRGDPDLFGRLVEDHDHHRGLLAMIEATHGASPERQTLFEELNRELRGHAAAEEQALWSSVMRKPDATDAARHAVAEHKQIDDLLADLAARNMQSGAWLLRFAALKQKYLHHIAEEEQEQFVEAQRVLSDKDVLYLKKVFERRKKAEKAAAKMEKKIKRKG